MDPRGLIHGPLCRQKVCKAHAAHPKNTKPTVKKTPPMIRRPRGVVLAGSSEGGFTPRKCLTGMDVPYWPRDTNPRAMRMAAKGPAK